MLSFQPGFSLPSLAVISQYHPRFALAAAEGVQIRPDVRELSVQFPSLAAIGQRSPQSFDQPISKESLFCGCELTVDPTTAFAGNILKGLNDTTMAMVSAVTFSMTSTGRSGNYTPIFDDVPLQTIPSLLKPFAGIWKFQGPSDNVKADFILQSAPNGGVPFTAWLLMSFAVLEGPCHEWDAMPIAEVRKRLRDVHGICCPTGG
jgi:hypothetical protein